MQREEEEEERKISPPKNVEFPKKPSHDFYAPHPFLNSKSSGGNIKVEDGAASDLSQGV
jgi:hypothetical protein